MPVERVPLVFPFGGLSEDRAFDEQLPGTTREATNVRGVDPKTGRVRGAQRSGLTRHLTNPLGPGKVQDLQALTYGQGRTDYTENSTPTLNWSRLTPSETAAISTAVDIQGNVYVVDEAANIVKYNSKGELLLVQAMATGAGSTVAKRILVDFSGNVFVATFGAPGTSGKLYKYDPVEVELDETVTKERLELAYSVDIAADIVDIAMRYGTLFALSSSNAQRARLTAYGFLNSSSPEEIWNRAVPYPANKVAVNSSGYPVCAFGPNADRAGDATGFSARSVSWVPHELKNSAQRLYHWADAQVIADQLVTFDSVAQWAERRQTLTSEYWTQVADTTDRGWFSDFVLNGLASGNVTAPEYILHGFGDMPSVRFDGIQSAANTSFSWGEALQGTPNTTKDNRATSSSLHAGMSALVPAHDAASFTYCGLVRITDLSTPQVLLSQVGNGNYLQIAFNVEPYNNELNTGQPPDWRFKRSPGRICVRYTNLNETSKSFHGSYNVDFSAVESPQPTASHGICLISFCMPTPSPDVSGTVTVADVESVRPTLRVNGVTIAYAEELPSSTGQYTEKLGPWGPESTPALGWISHLQTPQHDELKTVDDATGTGGGTTAHFDQHTVIGFSGDVMEQIVWLADDAASGRGLGATMADGNQANDDQWGRCNAAKTRSTDSVFYNREVPFPSNAISVAEADLQFTKNWKYSGSQPADATQGNGSTSHDPDAETVRGFATEVEQVEGYLAHKYGVQYLLPQGAGIDLAEEHSVDKVVVTDFGSRVAAEGTTSQVTITASDGPNSHSYQGYIEDGYLVAIEKLSTTTGSVGSAVSQTFIRYPTFDITSVSSFNGSFHIVWSDPWEGHPFALNAPKTGGGGQALTINALATTLFSDKPVVAKFKASNGDVAASFAGAGVGYGVAIDSNDDIFCVGPTDSAGTEFERYTIARKLIDKPSAYSSTASEGAFIVVNMTEENQTSDTFSDWDSSTADTTLDQIYNQPQLAADVDDDFYWPVNCADNTRHLYRFDGTQRQGAGYKGVIQAKIGTDSSDARFVYGLHASNADDDGAGTAGYQAGNQTAYAVAFDPNKPLYPDYGEGNSRTLEGPESLYLSTGVETTGTRNLHKLTLVSSEVNVDASPREALLLAVNNGDIHVISGTSKRTPDGGSQALNAQARHLQSAALYNKVFYTDGLNYRVYDPRGSELTGSETDKVEEWTAKSGGELPKRGKLLTGWRGRMVIANLADDPQEWHMSKQGDPYNWDLYPPVLNAQQAVAGSVSKIGKVPDIVNALVPYNDDLMIVGGDHTIWRFTGDPMFGGQLDLVSDITGISFGRAWCKDPEGVIYFFGSRGGVYAMSPASAPQKITANTIDRKLADIDLSVYRIELVWNTRDDGMHLYKIPYLGGGTVVSHFFWERKTGAWYEDVFGNTSVQPTAVTALDGDQPEDRALILGGEDGVLRRWTDTANSDDGHAIDSKVLIGPVIRPETDLEFRVDRLEAVFASGQGGGNFEIIPTDDPSTVGLPYSSGQLTAGRNPVIRARARGAAIYVRLSNSSAGERWALEDLAIHGAPAGRRRVR